MTVNFVPPVDVVSIGLILVMMTADIVMEAATKRWIVTPW
jgi:hypothetical protein